MSRYAFFRQSTWMVVTSLAGGGFMWLVHVILQKPVDQVNLGLVTEFLKRWVHAPLPKPEYSLFNSLLPMLALMAVPGIGLQTIFAQQAASAISDHQRHQLNATVRAVMTGTFVIWLLTALLILLGQSYILRELKISQPSALWITVLVGLPTLWLPILSGVLQGQQNFLWLGWSSIAGGFGRCFAVAIIVRLLGGHITGAMTAVLIGAISAWLICLWQTHQVWLGPSQPFPWSAWLRRVIPLTLGLGTTIFVLQADMLVVRSVFDKDQTAYYSAAGIIGRALVFFTLPMAAVMFPKVVQSAARAERTDVLAQALGATALLGALAALACTILPGLPLRVVYDSSYLVIKPLVPWFAWCMLPLTLANVLINNLLARERFRIVPWLMLVAAGYAGALVICAHRLAHAPPLVAFKGVVQILGLFSTILLAVAIGFTWRKA